MALDLMKNLCRRCGKMSHSTEEAALRVLARLHAARPSFWGIVVPCPGRNAWHIVKMMAAYGELEKAA